MEKTTSKILKEAKEILSLAVQKVITIEDACIVLNKSVESMTNILSKTETAYKNGVIKEKERDNLVELYTKYTKIIRNQKNKAKKSGNSIKVQSVTKTTSINRSSVNSDERAKNYVSSLSPMKKQIGEMLLKGMSPEQALESVAKSKSISKSDRSFSTYKAYVTMVIEGISNANGESNEKIYSDRKRLTKGPKAKVVKLKLDEELFSGLNDENLTKQEKEELEYNAETDDNYDKRSLGSTIRGEVKFVDHKGFSIKKIIGYKYKILIKGEPPLEGEFTRDEMDMIYQLYTSNTGGAGLTLRAVSRQYPKLSFKDFKRIIRAFNITKSSTSSAPHIMEEMSEDELVSLFRRNKEFNIYKKIEETDGKYYEKRFFETSKELSEYKKNDKESDEKIGQIIKNYCENNNVKLPVPVSYLQKDRLTKGKKIDDLRTNKPLICVFGDIHYGKKFDNTIFGRGYNKEIANERMQQIAEETAEESKRLKTKEIIMVSLGDLIECAMEDGMHPGHSREMDLHQEEQMVFAIKSINTMLEKMLLKTDCKITFCSILGNHDRMGIGRDDDKNRTSGKIISEMIKMHFCNEKRIEFILPSDNILKITRNKICIIAHHGDSGLNKRKPSELINLRGAGTDYHHLLLKGHWHALKVDEGTNFTSITAPSVASADKFIMDELGHNTLPGFVLCWEPADNRNCGLDIKKVTLY